MISDLDLLRPAKVVLDLYREDALLHCSKRADELLEKGDTRGYEIWCAILAVIESARLHLAAVGWETQRAEVD